MRNCIIYIIFAIMWDLRIFLKISSNRFKLIQKRGHLRILFFFFFFSSGSLNFICSGRRWKVAPGGGSWQAVWDVVLWRKFRHDQDGIILCEEVVRNLKAAASSPLPPPLSGMFFNVLSHKNAIGICKIQIPLSLGGQVCILAHK